MWVTAFLSRYATDLRVMTIAERSNRAPTRRSARAAALHDKTAPPELNLRASFALHDSRGEASLQSFTPGGLHVMAILSRRRSRKGSEPAVVHRCFSDVVLRHHTTNSCFHAAGDCLLHVLHPRGVSERSAIPRCGSPSTHFWSIGRPGTPPALSPVPSLRW